MTKEPKLDRAVRIAEEWSEVDSEIRRLQEKVLKNSSSTAEDTKKGNLKKDSTLV